MRVARPQAEYFRYAGPGIIRAKPKASAPTTQVGRAYGRVRRVLIGAPLATEQESEERLSKKKALAIMSSDAISSSAYASEEILNILVLAGAAALSLTLPIAIAISALLAVVAISYRQIGYAYPSGGGAYAVGSANLPKIFALIAAAALLIDYVMTVAVSTSSAIEQIYSAFPPLYPLRVEVSVLAVALILLGNMRGLRESGNIFALPTYIYIGSALFVVASGLLKAFVFHDVAATGYHAANVPTPSGGFEALTILLVLRAFAGGSVALTGTEAIANGVPAFQPPEPRNAARTLLMMAALLAIIFVGVTAVAVSYGILPGGTESVPALVARASVGTGPMFYVFQASAALILILASNTSFNAFPRLAAILAQDDYFPRAFAFRGDRLAFSTGIVVLAVMACVLLVAFDADTAALIPLYSVGVFVSFTISQTGMVRHWWNARGRGWPTRLVTNGIGAILTGVVAVVVASVKFTAGAWMVVVLVPIIVATMLFIHREYAREAEELKVRDDLVFGQPHRRQRVVVPVPGMTRAVVRAIAFGRTLSPDVRAIYVTDDIEEGERLRERFSRQLPGIPLVIVESPYRQLIGPLVTYLDVMEPDPDAITIVVVPEFVVRHWWERVLHNRTAARLRQVLIGRPNTVVALVPYRKEHALTH